MTVQELLDWCKTNGVSLDTHMVIRDKDDTLLIADNLSTDTNPYFGNCRNGGDELMSELAPENEGTDDTDERSPEPTFLMLGTGY